MACSEDAEALKDKLATLAERVAQEGFDVRLDYSVESVRDLVSSMCGMMAMNSRSVWANTTTGTSPFIFSPMLRKRSALMPLQLQRCGTFATCSNCRPFSELLDAARG